MPGLLEGLGLFRETYDDGAQPNQIGTNNTVQQQYNAVNTGTYYTHAQTYETWAAAPAQQLTIERIRETYAQMAEAERRRAQLALAMQQVRNDPYTFAHYYLDEHVAYFVDKPAAITRKLPGWF